jgi:type III secretory pathway component EscS
MTDQYAASDINHGSAPSEKTAITATMIEALRGTKRWVKLVGILLFIGAALTVIGALIAMVGAGVGAQKGTLPFGVLAFMALLYVGMALVYVYLGLHLVRYASAIGRLVADGLGESMEAALQHQQKFWRLAGILMLAGMAIGLLGIIAAIVIPIFASR